MKIPCDNTFLLILSSRSSGKVKVKYFGHSFRKKNGRYGGVSVSQTHLVLTCFMGKSRKYAGKKVYLNKVSNSQPPGHESDTLTTEPPGRAPQYIVPIKTLYTCS